MRCFPLFVAVAATALASQDSPGQKSRGARVDALFAKWARAGAPGCSVAVSKEGRLLHRGCYGLRDVESGARITKDTTFYAASVSKQFVAACVAHLADRGKLSLDDDIRKYVPEVHEFAHTITIRHLIHHRSGLRDYFELARIAGKSVDANFREKQALQLIAGQRELNFVPGSDYRYSNTGYLLLAVIIGRVTNSSLRAYARQQLFEPLGMMRSEFKDDPDQVLPEPAVGHRAAGAAYRPVRTRFALVGSGGLFTTASDLLRWLENFDRREWGGAKLLTQLETAPVLTPGQRLPPQVRSYAFGVVPSRVAGVEAIGHSGGSFGFRAHTLRFPAQKLCVAVLSNAADLPAAQLAKRVARIYLDVPDAGRSERAASDSSVATDSILPLRQPTFFREVASREVVSLVAQPARVRLALLAWQARLRPTARDKLENRDLAHPVTAEIRRDDEGRPAQLELRVGTQRARRFRYLPPVNLTEDELDAFVGEYRSPELGATRRVRRRGRILALVGLPFRFTAIDRDTLVSPGGCQLDFDRNDAGEISGLRISSGRSSNNWFERSD